MKDNAQYNKTIGEREVPQHRTILKDAFIEFLALLAKKKCPYPLRRIEAYNPEKDETLVFLTNHLDWGSTTIAALYKDRWQIEAFFRALKQNLKIKTFVGISLNAVKIQIWTALIAMLILRYLPIGFPVSLVAFEPGGSVADTSLYPSGSLGWLHEPFGILPFPYEPKQYALTLA